MHGKSGIGMGLSEENTRDETDSIDTSHQEGPEHGVYEAFGDSCPGQKQQ
jgi:hypothetical protein